VIRPYLSVGYASQQRYRQLLLPASERASPHLCSGAWPQSGWLLELPSLLGIAERFGLLRLPLFGALNPGCGTLLMAGGGPD
jgi:hypothetical protein